MIRSMKNLFLSMLVLLLSSGVSMATEQDLDQRVSTVMQKAGVNEQLAQFPQTVLAGLARSSQRLSTQNFEMYDRMQRAIGKAYAPALLSERVKQHLKKNLSENDLADVLAWLNSSLGERISRLEVAASSPESLAEMQRKADLLATDSGRVTRVKRFIRAVNATEVLISMSLNSEIAAAIGKSGFDASPGSFSEEQAKYAEEQVRNEFTKRMEPLRPRLENDILRSYLCTYAALTAEDFERYITFVESSAGKRYNAVLFQGISAAIVEASHDLGRRMRSR